MNNLFVLGFNQAFIEYIKKNNLEEFSAGRVAKQHKDSYIVLTREGNKRAVITGNLRYSASAKTDLPVVGDWVLLIASDDLYLIYQVLPRYSKLERQAVQRTGESQLIATNIDHALIVQSVDQNFNLNRLERYISITREISGRFWSLTKLIFYPVINLTNLSRMWAGDYLVFP